MQSRWSNLPNQRTNNSSQSLQYDFEVTRNNDGKSIWINPTGKGIMSTIKKDRVNHWKAQLFPAGGSRYQYIVSVFVNNNFYNELLNNYSIIKNKYSSEADNTQVKNFFPSELPSNTAEKAHNIFSSLLNQDKYDMSQQKVTLGKKEHTQSFNFSISYETHDKQNVDDIDKKKPRASMSINIHIYNTEETQAPSTKKVISSFDTLYKHIEDEILVEINSSVEKQRLTKVIELAESEVKRMMLFMIV